MLSPPNRPPNAISPAATGQEGLALAERERLKGEFGAAMAGVDAVLTPVALTAAVRLGEVDQGTTPALLTRWVNLLDLCGLAVPAGFTAEGLPTSLQIACPAYREATALRIGWALEQASEWHRRQPELS